MTAARDISIQGTGPNPDEPRRPEPMLDPDGTEDAAEIDVQSGGAVR